MDEVFTEYVAALGARTLPVFGKGRWIRLPSGRTVSESHLRETLGYKGFSDSYQGRPRRGVAEDGTLMEGLVHLVGERSTVAGFMRNEQMRPDGSVLAEFVFAGEDQTRYEFGYALGTAALNSARKQRPA